MNISTRIARLEAQSAVGKDPRTMTDQELDAEIARLKPICAALPPDPEIDAEIERLRRKLYPQEARGTDETAQHPH